MSDHWYRDGELLVLVRSGARAEHNVKIGTGDTYDETLGNLQITPIQSAGRDGGIASALRWASGEMWVSNVNDLVEDSGPDNLTADNRSCSKNN